MPVEQGGHAVEAESVKVKLFQPVAQVGEEKSLNLNVAVVEALGIPTGVFAPFADVKVLPSRAVEIVESLANILDGVGVHHVHEDGETKAVRGVHQVLEILWRSKA